MKNILFSILIFTYQFSYSQVNIDKKLDVEDKKLVKEKVVDKKEKEKVVDKKSEKENKSDKNQTNLNDIQEKSNQIFSKELLGGVSENEEYLESEFRRFEITFFLTTPMFILYQLILHQFIVSVSFIKYHNEDNDIFDFTDLQWGYSISSGILAGLFIGLDRVFPKETEEETKKLNIQDIQEEEKKEVVFNPIVHFSILNIKF